MPDVRKKERYLILGVGELLWDMLPSGPLLGGAPANFSVMAGKLGNHAAILSRIGRDGLGRQAMETLDPMPVDTSMLEVDQVHETGRVTVSFAGSEPRYAIHQPAAWDFLELTDEWMQLAERADALCFGSLAQRSLQSRQTIQSLVAQAPRNCIRVFDVNLRPPFYSSEVIQESLELATVMKMNEEEAPKVLQLLGLEKVLEPGALLQTAQSLLAEFPSLQLVAVTRGGRGSLLVTRHRWHDHPGYPVQVADTIGAGDAFTAALTHSMLRCANLETGLARLNETGSRWGSWMATQTGAMPDLPDAVRETMEKAIDARI